VSILGREISSLVREGLVTEVTGAPVFLTGLGLSGPCYRDPQRPELVHGHYDYTGPGWRRRDHYGYGLELYDDLVGHAYVPVRARPSTESMTVMA